MAASSDRQSPTFSTSVFLPERSSVNTSVISTMHVNHKNIDGDTRQQIGALPFTRDNAGRVQVMLVTSRETRRWVIPKGWPMQGKKPHRAAKLEAFEEAGLLGRVGKEPL